jgi:hypothetical protein
VERQAITPPGPIAIWLGISPAAQAAEPIRSGSFEPKRSRQSAVLEPMLPTATMREPDAVQASRPVRGVVSAPAQASEPAIRSSAHIPIIHR